MNNGRAIWYHSGGPLQQQGQTDRQTAAQLVPAALGAGKPGSRLRSINTYRLRIACTPGKQQLKAVLALERSKLFPGSTAPQDIVLKDVTYRVSGGDCVAAPTRQSCNT